MYFMNINCLNYLISVNTNWQIFHCKDGGTLPWQQGLWGQHGAHLGTTGPRWAPCWPHEPCSLGMFNTLIRLIQQIIIVHLKSWLCTNNVLGHWYPQTAWSQEILHHLIFHCMWRCTVYHSPSTSTTRWVAKFKNGNQTTATADDGLARDVWTILFLKNQVE